MSDDLIKRAASKNKNTYIVKGANHMSMYDSENYIDEAVSKLAPFFKSNVDATKVEPVAMARQGRSREAPGDRAGRRVLKRSVFASRIRSLRRLRGDKSCFCAPPPNEPSPGEFPLEENSSTGRHSSGANVQMQWDHYANTKIIGSGFFRLLRQHSESQKHREVLDS